MSPKSFALIVTLICAGCATQPGPTPAGSSAAAAPAATSMDGKSFDTAIVIAARDDSAGVKAEYAWIREHIPGGRPAGQALLHHGTKMYDLIHVQLPDGTIRDVYFDITGFFGKSG